MAAYENNEQERNQGINSGAGVENTNGTNETNGVNETGHTNNTSGTQTGANPVGGESGANPYAYQNGYYRNTTPHQDESVYNSSSYGTARQTGSPSGNTQENGGYTYVNYYSNPSGGNMPDEKNKKPKKKHTGLKVTAFILAMVVVSGASIGIYQGVQDSMDVEDSTISDTSENSGGSSDADTSADADSANNSTSGESWIELASADGSMSVTEIVEKVTPSVVGVTATYTMASSSDSSYYNFFGYDDSSSSEATGVGTGIIMSEDGYIITNAHVIYDEDYGYGEATAVQITMSDEETVYDAEIVAYDVETDLAVLKIDETGLTAAEFGDSTQLQVGEMVVAIGNPLGLEFQNTVTCGIISALNREVTINDKKMTLIQTDTAINSGNSGGPLINSAGQVIGINSAKMSSSYSSSSASVEGMGFAIPMTEAQEIIDDLINYGYVTGRPQLGITCQDVSETVSQAYGIPVGCYIVSVTDGGAADLAGLQAGDVITGIQGETVSTTEELNNIKNEYNAGDTITLTIVRSSETMEVEVTLEEVTSTADESSESTTESSRSAR